MAKTRVPSRTSAHSKSIGSARDDVLRALAAGLGKNAVATVLGQSVRTIERWLKDGAKPMTDEEERVLRDTYQIFMVLVDSDDVHVARAWFLGMNPHLDDSSPIDALVAGRAREVIAAARTYANGA